MEFLRLYGTRQNDCFTLALWISAAIRHFRLFWFILSWISNGFPSDKNEKLHLIIILVVVVMMVIIIMDYFVCSFLLLVYLANGI